MHNPIQDALRQPFGSLAHLVTLQAQQQPAKVALVLGDTELNYAQLCAGMERVARTLAAHGLHPGDTMAICAGTCVEYVIAFLGALRAGVAVAPLAPSATAEHLSAMLDNSGARLVLRDRDVAAQWPVSASADVQCVALDDAEQAGQPWSQWLEPASGAAPAPIHPEPDWPFNVIYSSGTTGAPKGIVQSWAMRWSHVQRAVSNGYGVNAVSLCATPLYSNTTLVAALPTLALGGTLVLMRKFDATKYFALAARHGATHTMLVPVQYQRLLRCPDFDRTDLSTLTHKFCTSAPFSAALKAEVLQRWPGSLIEYYGMTEGGVRCELHCHQHPDKLHTVGRAVTGSELRFIDESGQEVPPGTLGEIVGRSAGMMSGYYRLPEKSREVEWFDAQGQRYIRSGDVGRQDADGFIVLGDRMKDMIITGGFNVYPSDIEATLVTHPGVAECAVIGVPSEAWGETPVAYVVPKAASDAGEMPSADDLRQWLNARVGKVQRVAQVVITDALPRSEIGKVLKRNLRDRFVQDAPGVEAHHHQETS